MIEHAYHGLVELVRAIGGEEYDALVALYLREQTIEQSVPTLVA